MIIDVHYHVGYQILSRNETGARNFTRYILDTCQRTGYSKPLDEVYPQIRDLVNDVEGDKLVKRMAKNGIDKTVVCIVDNYASGMPTSNIMELNELCAAMAKKHPGKLISLAGIDPRRPEAPALLRRCLGEYKMSGLKWHPDMGYYPNSPEAYNVLKVLNEFGCPLLTHCSPLPGASKAKYAHPIHLDDIATDFPNIEIIAAHMGFLWWHEWAALAQFKKNISGDMAVWQCIAMGRQALFRRYLREIIDNIGPNQILWGTDGPFYEPVISNKKYIELLQALTVRDNSGIVFSQAEVDAILGGNANRIFIEATTQKSIEYADTINRFSFSYNKNWPENAVGSVPPVVAWFALLPWYCPAVHVDRYPTTTVVNLEKLLESSSYLSAVGGKDTIIGKIEEMANSFGTKATAITFKYTAADGTVLDAKAYGCLKGDSWYVMSVYQAPGLGTLESVMPDEIFNSWRFLK